jgi:hypothetical protein
VTLPANIKAVTGLIISSQINIATIEPVEPLVNSVKKDEQSENEY